MEEIEEGTLSALESERRNVIRWRNKQGGWSLDASFVIFHAPLNWQRVPLLIIGQNPGMTKVTRKARADEALLRDENFLFESTDRYALTAYAIFAKAGRLNHLKFAQSTDINFFRNTHSEGARALCADAVSEIVRQLKPKRIIITGKKAAQSFIARCLRKSAGRKRKSKVGKVSYGILRNHRTILVCPHFSRRSKVRAKDWEKLIADLRVFLPQDTEQDLERFCRH